MDKKEQTRLRVERYREKQKALHDDSVTPGSVTEKAGDLAHAAMDKRMLKRPNQLINGVMKENWYDPEEMLLDGRKRYLPCHDGQVLDRKTVKR